MKIGKLHTSVTLLCLIFLSSCSVLEDIHSDKRSSNSSAEESVFDAQLTKALQKTLEEINDIQNSDTISASLYISDRCYWEGAAGTTKQDPDVPVKSDMIFGFGSITKIFVAAIVLQLAEESRISIDEPLGNWLAQYPNIDSEITVRQLLNHGSALDDYFGDDRYWSEIDADPNRVWMPDEILKLVEPPPFNGFNPPEYSNTNYILLGMIIEAVTGNSLEDEFQNRIAGPLQLGNTYLPKNGFHSERWANNTALYNSLYSSVWTAGAIASTSKEIAKFNHALFSGRFLESASLESMLVTEPRRLGRSGLLIGLGAWKLSLDGNTAWGHGGALDPFLSLTFYLPKFGLSVAYSSSGEGLDRQLLPGQRLLRTYIEHEPKDISTCFDS